MDPVAALPGLPERYELLSELGRGGSGAVFRVRDRELQRTVALKVLRPEHSANAEAVARFREEARVGARLQHAGLVPVHDHGALADGRPWFTMREVRGQPFGQMITAVHGGPEGAGTTGLRRLVEVFAKVCDAVAYAHQRGVLHRDLKPANVVVSEHGDVLVVDWGLAKVVGSPSDDDLDDSTFDAPLLTRAGRVSGTPAYMSPEQARGDADAVDRRSDVWALGAVLYELLTGVPPYEGRDVRSILRQVLAGPPPDPRDFGGGGASDTVSLNAATISFDPEPVARRPLPEALVAVWERAMRPEQDQRFADAGALAREVHAWLDGSAARERALGRLAASDELRDRAGRHGAEAARLRAESVRLLGQLTADASEDDRLPGWEAARRADVEEALAEDCRGDAQVVARSALELAPELDVAHGRALLDLVEEHRAASARGDERACNRIVRAATRHIPLAHEAAREAWTAAIRREARLTLRTDPPGAEVELYSFEDHFGRLVPRFERILGTTPLEAVTVPAGSSLCMIRHRERPSVVRYPIAPEPNSEWRPVPPRSTGLAPAWARQGGSAADGEPAVVPLRRLGEAGSPHPEVLVPAGWFEEVREIKGLNEVPKTAPSGSGSSDRLMLIVQDNKYVTRVWIPDLVVRVFPVTRGEWQRWVVAGGPAAEVEIAGPEDRRPVSGVSLGDAVAYAAWYASKTGLPWRLPVRNEWRRFAGGVDGRRYPWGSRFDDAWVRVRRTGGYQASEVVDVDADLFDESVFGVRGCGGNVSEWTPWGLVVRGAVEPAPHRGETLPVSGGSVFAGAQFAEVAESWNSDGMADASIGFRLVRTWAG